VAEEWGDVTSRHLELGKKTDEGRGAEQSLKSSPPFF
jgi:hypothetical protein